MTKKLFMLSAILLAYGSVLAKSPDLTQMTEEEKQLTGLNKLTADELNMLSQWLKNRQLIIDRETRQRNAGFESRQRGGDRRNIRARLDKQYTDKLGRTYYELDNGQIWKAVSSGSVYLEPDGRQLITIEPAALGSWQMQGDGNRSVKVKRIK